MKNFKKTTRNALYFLLVKCVFCVGLQAQDTLNYNFGVSDSLITHIVDTIDYTVDIFDIFEDMKADWGLKNALYLADANRALLIALKKCQGNQVMKTLRNGL